MIVPLTIDRSSLFRPLTDRAVLVSGEDVFYAQRQHWASIAQPVYETFIFLLFVIWVVNIANQSESGVDLGNALLGGGVGIILGAAAIHAGVLALTGGAGPISRLAVDPFSSGSGTTGIGRFGRWTLGILIGLFALSQGLRVGAIIAVFLVIGRLILFLARWAFYERRFITNRRLIESSGFLGSRISSMPLSRVTDIVYGRTVPGEVFGYARMRIETAGQDQALGVVRFIAEPDHFYDVLVQLSAPIAPGSATADAKKDGTN